MIHSTNYQHILDYKSTGISEIITKTKPSSSCDNSTAANHPDRQKCPNRVEQSTHRPSAESYSSRKENLSPTTRDGGQNYANTTGYGMWIARPSSESRAWHNAAAISSEHALPSRVNPESSRQSPEPSPSHHAIMSNICSQVNS